MSDVPPDKEPAWLSVIKDRIDEIGLDRERLSRLESKVSLLERDVEEIKMGLKTTLDKMRKSLSALSVQVAENRAGAKIPWLAWAAICILAAALFVAIAGEDLARAAIEKL
ncbi:MAG: hypothetical protein AAF725_19085 [Acidobacteriota bacterium]